MVLTRWHLALGLMTAAIATGRAEDKPRHAERTPPVHFPLEHTMQRAGNPTNVAWWARPSIGRHDAGGYVGGGTLKGNRPLSRTVIATGPLESGTYGLDYVGVRDRMGRVFLASSGATHKERSFYFGYRTDGPHVPDVFALRPVRKAVLEAKEDNPGHKGTEKE